MYTVRNDCNHILVIGNGFDLNLNLKTGYKDFIKSVYFDDILHGNNPLAVYLNNQHELQNWIDIENELKRYSNRTPIGEKIDTFEKDFYGLSNALQDYLINIDYSNVNKLSHSYNLLMGLYEKEFLIFDFNYTNTVKVLLKDIGYDQKNIDRRVIKVHGSLEEKQIIFGVEDNARIRPEHVFLRKAYNQHFKGVNMNSVFRFAAELHIFGHSLGETDHMYFDEFFQSITNHNTSGGGKNIKLYHYGNEGYKNLFMQLDALTRNRLSMLWQINNFIPIDTSI